MAKINIAGVKQGTGKYTVHVVLTEMQKIEDEQVDVPIGEAFPEFLDGTKPSAEKQGIIKAAEGIRERARDAKRKRIALQKLEFPEIEE